MHFRSRVAAQSALIAACHIFLAATVGEAKADLTPAGEVQSSFDSPHRAAELCASPRNLNAEATLAGGAPVYLPFSERERAVTRTLCVADFYDRRESTPEVGAVVTCPKVHSTNPAVMFHTLPLGMSRATYIARECPKVENRAGSQIAKFKQSVSCSYTPSILVYPRIARILQSDIELPFTAYRSMDRREHLDFAAKAKDLAARVTGPDSIIAQTWRMIYRDDLNPAASPRRNALFKEEDLLLFGALVPNLSGDTFYGAANGSTVGDRLENFQGTAAFQRVADPRPVSKWGLGNRFTPENAQRLLLLRELGDLIVLDTLLNQQDRFGNLHYRTHYAKVGEDGIVQWELAKRAAGNPRVWDAEQAARLGAAGYVLVKRMLMTDNDCGVAKENRMASANGGRGVAYRVNHLHPDTYRGLQRLQRLAQAGLLAPYLKQEFIFRDSDVKSVLGNLASLATLFREKCLAGTLFLDADAGQFTGVKPPVEFPSFCAAN